MGSLISDKYIEKSLERANKGNVRGFFNIKFVSNSDGLMTFEIEIPNTCLNPLGTVQGGMIVSILDETTAYHVNIITNDKLIPNSTDIHVSFHRPLLIGQCFSRTEILKLGKKVVSIKGQVFSTDDKLIATAMHTGLLLSTEKLKWSLIRINLEVKIGSYIEEWWFKNQSIHCWSEGRMYALYFELSIFSLLLYGISLIKSEPRCLQNKYF